MNYLHKKGQSTVEILVALTMFIIGVSAMITLVLSGQTLTVNTSETNRATSLARENLENAAATARNNFPSLVSASSTQGEFTKQIIVTDVDANTKKVISRVSWSTDPARPEKVEVTELITNWRTVKDTGSDTGGTDTTGNWRAPVTLGSTDLGSGVSATNLDVLNKYVYLTSQAGDPKKDDFYVVDATDGQNVHIVTSTNTGVGLNAVDDIVGTSFVAQNDTSNQLQIINTSNPLTGLPILSQFTLPNVSGAGAVGQSIFYAAGKIYMGTDQANGPEFHVIDVTNPQSPTELGSFEVGADVNMIRVSGHYAYLATSDNSKELKILDVSNPAAISEVGSYNAAGTEDGLAVYIYGSTLYLGRISSGDPDFYILNVSNPANVTSVGSATLGANIYGIRIRNNLAFIGTSASNQEFQVWDISNPASPSMWSSFNFPQVVTGVDYENNLVYVSVRSNDGLRIITSGQ